MTKEQQKREFMNDKNFEGLTRLLGFYESTPESKGKFVPVREKDPRHRIADYWLAKQEEAVKEAREEERKMIIKEYGHFNDGCGCCARDNLGNELENIKDEINK